jgi:lipopolysaccharide exporter
MDIATRVLKGSSTLLLIKVIERSFGIVTLLILARLLTPEDFSIVSICTIAVYFFDAISQAGAKEYLIQKETIDDQDLNTAWTINIGLKFLLWLIFVLITPYVADYFSKPELASPLYTISFVLLISGFYNVAVIHLHRDLNYRPFLKIALYQKIVSSVIVLTLAFLLQSYWAMIVGVILTTLIPTIMSYTIYPYRPKLCIVKFIEQFSFSIWLLFNNIIGYTRSEIDSILFTTQFNLEHLGGYTMMKNLSSIPAREIIKPATEPLLPAFAKDKTNKKDTALKLEKSLLLISIASIPVTTFVYFKADTITLILLGNEWTQYSLMLSYFSLMIFNFSIGSILAQALLSLGKPKSIFYFDAAALLIIGSALFSLSFSMMSDLVLTRSLIIFTSTFLLLLYTGRFIPFRKAVLLYYLLIIALITLIAHFVADFIVEINNLYISVIVYAFTYASVYLLGIILFLYGLKHQESPAYVIKLTLSLLYKLKNR